MRRGRIIFWSISGTIIAAGIGACIWYARPPNVDLAPSPLVKQLQDERRAKDERPPEPWTSPDPWWKRTTIDAFDRANQGKSWPAARRAVVAFAKDYSEDAGVTGDEYEDALSASGTAIEYECADPLVLCIRGRSLWDRGEGNSTGDAARTLAQAADAFPSSQYHAVHKSLCLLWTAEAAAGTYQYLTKIDPKKTAEYADAGVVLAREALADPELPAREAYRLVRYAGNASIAIYHDRATLADRVMAALEQSRQPRSVVATARGEYMKDLAWDARGSDVAAAVTEPGWKGFKARLADARAALEQAWDLDHANAFAATEMITVCMGEGADRAEMERWFKRAIDANSGIYDACIRKLLFLEPKWGGSPVDMIMFGRELARGPAGPTTAATTTSTSTNLRAARLPINLVDAHWTLGQYAQGSRSDYPAIQYFADNADVWNDVSGVYEAYLAKVPESRYHRTRYAVIAAWAGHWDVAAAQFDRLGDNYSRRVLPEPALAALRDRAKAKAKAR